MRDAEVIAVELGVPAGQLFKTLVVLPPGVIGRTGKPLLIMLPADRQLNLKKLAKAVGAKKLQMATHADAEKLTGLQVGGISPLALLNRGFKIIIHNSVLKFEEVHISGGERGVNIRLASSDLINLTQARIAEIC